MNRSMPGPPVHNQLPEFTQTHVHRVSDAIHPSHPRPLLLPPPMEGMMLKLKLHIGYVANIFPFYKLSFVSLIVSFDVQKLLSFM